MYIVHDNKIIYGRLSIFQDKFLVFILIIISILVFIRWLQYFCFFFDFFFFFYCSFPLCPISLTSIFFLPCGEALMSLPPQCNHIALLPLPPLQAEAFASPTTLFVKHISVKQTTLPKIESSKLWCSSQIPVSKLPMMMSDP